MNVASLFVAILQLLVNFKQIDCINVTVYQSVLEDSKIVGGQPATIGQFPYQVAVIIGQSGLCGGSLISTREVLTAAHCTVNRSPGQFVVRIGSLQSSTGGQTRTVSQIKQHPQFNPTTIDNDISMLVLSSPVVLSNTVGLVTLPTQEPLASTVCSASGYGRLMENGPQSGNLQYVDLPIVSRTRCRAVYGITTISANMICAGYTSGGKDTCQGDSGGPLVLAGTNTQVGIVSYGSGCARPNVPGVYTNLARYVGWIRGEVQPNNLCTGFLDLCNRLNLSILCAKLQLMCGIGNSLG